LTISDRNLPLEAAVDLEKMRETLELVVEQSKTIGADKSKSADAMALLEEATTTRVNLAKDDYDAKRWKDAVSDAREQLTSRAASSTPLPKRRRLKLPQFRRTLSLRQTLRASRNLRTVKPNDSATLFKPVSNDTAADQPNTPGASNNKPAADPVAANIGAANTSKRKRKRAKEQSKTPELEQ
jgi:hypothetical protein